MTDRDRERLAELHPALVDRLEKVFAVLEILEQPPMTITSGKRSLFDQQRLYAQGRTAPGDIVTNADGVLRVSKHQTGRAVDCVFVVNGAPSWSDTLPWNLYGAVGMATGLVWGGTFTSIHDRPHLELPPSVI